MYNGHKFATEVDKNEIIKSGYIS